MTVIVKVQLKSWKSILATVTVLIPGLNVEPLAMSGTSGYRSVLLFDGSGQVTTAPKPPMSLPTLMSLGHTGEEGADRE